MVYKGEVKASAQICNVYVPHLFVWLAVLTLHTVNLSAVGTLHRVRHLWLSVYLDLEVTWWEGDGDGDRESER